MPGIALVSKLKLLGNSFQIAMGTIWISKTFGKTENSHIANENRLKNAHPGVLILRGRHRLNNWKTNLALIRELYLYLTQMDTLQS